jgi:hypothetical protein
VKEEFSLFDPMNEKSQVTEERLCYEDRKRRRALGTTKEGQDS